MSTCGYPQHDGPSMEQGRRGRRTLPGLVTGTAGGRPETARGPCARSVVRGDPGGLSLAVSMAAAAACRSLLLLICKQARPSLGAA